jgi:hypothetical protein
MTETERYIFDLNGYLVMPGALSSQEVDEINAVIDKVLPDWHVKAKAGHIVTGWDAETMQDENTDPTMNAVGLYAGRLLDWGEPIRKLVGHETILPCMIEIIGPTLRLDHQYAILMRSKPATAGHYLHCGGTPYDPVHSYHFRNGRFFSGLTTVSYALTDVPEGAGGFCCIPGSHKSSVQRPRHFSDVSNSAECLVHVPLKRGDAVIFTEALTHGSLPWKTEDDRERRALLFKYCPGYMQWEKRPQLPSMEHKWKEHQKYLLEPPYVGDRPPINWPPAVQKKDGTAAD